MPPMAKLGAKERAQLPDSAFAYIDSQGKRRLPIHDAAHVRNALARFSQVHFEDEAARDRDAVEAALAIQRAMQDGGWPGGIDDVRLRIGLHRGRPTLTDTGYVGISVHAAARICFAAHGGQIVLSGAVRSAVLDTLPDGVALKELGAWRFRGLPEPVTIYQVEADGLLDDFP